ncbi:MAG: bacterial Ig-like domain-containing protein [Ruminococcus callidus]|nr:bacterial Ig-like domain-containing protein [Ruminococcus callidus]
MKRKFAVLTAAIVWLSITAFTSVSSQKFYTFPKNDASALSIIANIKEVSLENDSIKIGETTHLKASFDTGITYNAQCYSSDSSIVKVLSGSANDGWEIEGIASGTAKIIVSNGGIYEKSIDITVEDVSLPTETTTEQIVLVEPGCYINTVSKPVKSVYQVGEALDLTGLKVDVMFAPGGEMPISQINKTWRKVIDAANPLENDYFVVDTSEFDSSKTGTYNVKISLTDEACKKWWYCYPAKISVTVLDEIVKGDVNADEKFDISDVVLLQKWLLGVSDVTIPNWKAADFCEDGKLNVLDLCMMKSKLIYNDSECNERTESIIPGLKNGMTAEEVFNIIGKDYVESMESSKDRIGYFYTYKEDNVFETNLEGQLFIEIDSKTDTLVNFGYHFGRLGNNNKHYYPYTETKLKTTYDIIMKKLTQWYGNSLKGTLVGPEEENIWDIGDDQIWAIYGVNLWTDTEPDTYEEGINEIVVSCSYKPQN